MELQIGLRAETAPAFAQAAAARNLQLLRAIESTIISIASDTRLMQGMAGDVSDMLAAIQKANVSSALDPSGVVCQDLGLAADITSSLYARARARHQDARNDFRLTRDDGVADAYGAYIDAARSLHDQIEELREWIATHDAVLEPGNGKFFDTAEALFASFGVTPAR